MRVTLYTRAGCGLCEKADAMLQRLQARGRFDLEYIDLDSDAEADRRYWARIPVVALDGEEVAAAPLDESQLAAILIP